MLRRVASRQNALIKELRQAFAQAALTEDGCCAIEGVRLVEEALRSGLRLKAVFVSQGAEQRAERLLPQVSSHAEALLVPADVFAATVQTEAPQGIAALVQVRQWELKDILRAAHPLIVIAAGVQDPGNLGTMVRSAEAFGANGLLAAEGTVSPYNSKAVRAAAGSLFRLPVIRVALNHALEALREQGMRVLGTSSHRGTPAHQADLTGGLALLVGNEGAGLGRHLAAAADGFVAIPHEPRVESLNAGIAAAVLLYEAARQRRALS
ncbi:MAG: RNA methyltransferase [Acidobacteria bacterium]|nr:RNA methyltransferase [Acidobacteriota bacterium]